MQLAMATRRGAKHVSAQPLVLRLVRYSDALGDAAFAKATQSATDTNLDRQSTYSSESNSVAKNRLRDRNDKSNSPGGPAMTSRNSRIGLALFFVYLALYAGFVLLAAFSPATLERTPLAGVNLAIWYGFGLIAAAFVLALVYGWLCRSAEPGNLDPGASPPNQVRNPQSAIRNPE
jgi:uncharacterized membrane protein (DUF485 family)